APEQFAGVRAIDQRVDIYASALVMYQMLEGRLPFGGSTPAEVAKLRCTQAPAPLSRSDCPPALASMVLQCLATSPDDRPASAEAVLAGLDRPGAAARAQPRRSLVAAGLAAVVLAGTALGAGYLGRERSAAGAGAPSGPSVAILPVVNLSQESGDASLADGMTEELIAVLSQGRTLRVVASTSVRALQSRGLEVRQLAESLHVSHVLESGIQKVGTKLRMHVRLVDAENSSTRWSETYDRDIGDIFAIQDDIARAVAEELDVRLALGAGPAPERPRPTPSVAAYEWYLRGKQQELLRSSEGRSQGMDYLHRAIALDSSFAAAHAALVWLYLNMAGSNPGDYPVWLERAEAAALKAVTLDSTLADAHSALGWSRIQADRSAAEASLLRAVALDPLVNRGYEGLARLYMFTRRPAKQLTAARLGLAADPYAVAANREMALALSNNGRCDEALQLLRPLKDLNPPAAVAGVIRGICYARMQKWPESLAELRWAEEAGARAALGLEGYVLATSGRHEEARALLADLLAGRKRSHGAFGIALLYTGLRDYDRALEYLEISLHEGSLRVYIMDPLFKDLHEDPRFARLWTSKPNS
ncbi:MAG TPA: hypothetical protein VF171_02840, partial [Trueperaceae bacterium]